jgi:ornithine cyclodeaminase/alanine dehydrogenase-like protein (mu-crystallin family)
VAVAPAGTPRQAVRGADVICTATRSAVPLFEAADLAPGAHINAVGAYRLDMSEVPPEAFRRASPVVIDQLEAALAEAGDLVDALDGGYLGRADIVEIGQLLIGNEAQAGADSADVHAAAPAAASGPGVSSGPGLTIFKSVGIAAQDWAVCELAVRRAREAGAMPGAPEDGGAVIA